MENKQKRGKFCRSIIGVLIMVVVAGFMICGCSIGDTAPKVVINDVELSTGTTVQEIVDAGFQICLSSVGGDELDVANYIEVPGESYMSERYYIYVQDEYGFWTCTNVSFSVYNPSVNSVNFAKSKIYSYQYYTADTLYPCEVTINGVNFKEMSKEEAVTAFEGTGMSFEEDEKEAYLNGESLSVYGKSGDYSYIFTQDYENINLEWVEVRKKV